MTALAIELSDPPTLTEEAVSRALEMANGNFVDASRLLADEAKKNQKLYLELTANYLDRACWEVMCRRAQNERAIIWQAPHAEPKIQKGGRVEHLARENARSLLDMPLPIHGLPRLGDAVREQVSEASHYYVTHAKDANIKGKFLELIAQQLPAGVRVREKFSEANLEKLQKEVKI